MKRIIFLILAMLGFIGNAQFKYKVEYDWTLTPEKPIQFVESHSYDYYLCNEKTNLVQLFSANAVYGQEINDKKNEVFQFNKEITHFGEAAEVYSGGTSPDDCGSSIIMYREYGAACESLPMNGCTTPSGPSIILPIKKLRDLNTGALDQLDKCHTQTITVFDCNSRYQSQYAVYYIIGNSPRTQLLPYAKRSGTFSFSYAQIEGIGSDGKFDLVVDYIPNPVLEKDKSDRLQLRFIDCSIDLDTTISPNPAPFDSNCYGGTDGGFTVTFERELDASKREKLNLQVLQKLEGVFQPLYADTLVKSSFNGTRSYTWQDGMPAGIYKIIWQTKSGGDSFDSSPDAFKESLPFVIGEPDLLTISTTHVDEQCLGEANGSITVTTGGGTPPYSYIIDSNPTNPQTSNTFNNLAAGDYTVRLIDTNNCTISTIETVGTTYPFVPKITPVPGRVKSPTRIDGNNGSIQISVADGSGEYTTYQWTKDGAAFTPSANSSNRHLVDLYEGVYTVVVTDTNGCEGQSDPFNLTDPNPVEVTITMSPELLDCYDSKVVLTASATEGYLEANGEYTYLWSDGSVDRSLFDVGQGTYSVTVTDMGENSTTEQITVSGPTPIQAEVTITSPLSCNNGSDAGIQLDITGGTGAYVIIWENMLDSSFSAFGRQLSNLGHGEYVYRVLDQNGCVLTNDNDPIQIANPDLFFKKLGEDRFFCEGQTVSLSAKVADPGAQYTWSADTGFTSNNAEIQVTQEGVYAVEIISSKGCMTSDTIHVIENIKEIEANFLYASQIFTNEAVILIDVTYPIPDQIEWSIPKEASVITNDQELLELSFEKPGTYEIQLTSKLGDCQDSFLQKIVVLQGEEFKEQPTSDTQEALKNIKEFTCYPNPSDGKFAVTVTLKEIKEVSIKVFSLANNTILAHKKVTGSKEYTIPFDLQLASGIYAVVLETPYGKDIRKVVVR